MRSRSKEALFLRRASGCARIPECEHAYLWGESEETATGRSNIRSEKLEGSFKKFLLCTHHAACFYITKIDTRKKTFSKVRTMNVPIVGVVNMFSKSSTRVIYDPITNRYVPACLTSTGVRSHDGYTCSRYNIRKCNKTIVTEISWKQRRLRYYTKGHVFRFFFKAFSLQLQISVNIEAFGFETVTRPSAAITITLLSVNHRDGNLFRHCLPTRTTLLLVKLN